MKRKSQRDEDQARTQRGRVAGQLHDFVAACLQHQHHAVSSNEMTRSGDDDGDGGLAEKILDLRQPVQVSIYDSVDNSHTLVKLPATSS